MHKFKIFLQSKGFLNWMSRLVAIALALAGLEQILMRFKVDILDYFSLDLAHFSLIILILSLTSELWIAYNSKDNLVTKSVIPRNDFGKSILSYITYLKSIQKNVLVVDLRNKLTHLFHLLGLNEEREKLGEIALSSTAVINDDISKSEILIDDLGWAIFLQGRTKEASKNILKALTTLNQVNANNNSDLIRLKLAEIKAFRHLAFLSNSIKKQNEYIVNCNNAHRSIKNDKKLYDLFKDEIKTHEAQIYHAESFLTAKNLNVHITGEITTEEETVQHINDSISKLEKSVELFSEVGDLERQAKAMVLHERLLQSLGDELGALEVKAKREKLISESGIDGGLETITLSNSTKIK